MKTESNVPQLVKFTARIIKRMNRVLAFASAAVLIIVMLAIAVDTVMRYFLNSPITGVNQLTTYGLVWICFLGVGWVTVVRGHLMIEVVVARFLRAERLARKHLMFTDIISLGYTLPLFWVTAKATWVAYDRWSLLFGELEGIPEFVIIWVVPLGFLAISLQLIVNVVTEVLGIKGLETTSAGA